MRLVVLALASFATAACGGSSSSDDFAGGGGGSGQSGTSGTAGSSSGGTSNGGTSGSGQGGALAGSGNTAGSGGSTQAGSSGGGAAGGGGSGAAGGAGGAGGGSGCDCVGATITWGMDGGNVAYREESAVTPCKTYSHERIPQRTDPPSLRCETILPVCGNSLGVGDVNATLATADVQAALAQAPVLYGRDSRPVDGQVLRLDIGGEVIEIGSPCAQAAGCVEPPAGVSALVELLQSLDEQELAKEPCLGTFD